MAGIGLFLLVFWFRTMRLLVPCLLLLALAAAAAGDAESTAMDQAGAAGEEGEGSCAAAEVGYPSGQLRAWRRGLWAAIYLSDDGVEHVQAIEKVEPKYKPSQAALTAFFKLHEPSDENWKAPFAVLEVTDGCPLNGMYRRCVFLLTPSAGLRSCDTRFCASSILCMSLAARTTRGAGGQPECGGEAGSRCGSTKA